MTYSDVIATASAVGLLYLGWRGYQLQQRTTALELRRDERDQEDRKRAAAAAEAEANAAHRRDLLIKPEAANHVNTDASWSVSLTNQSAEEIRGVRLDAVLDATLIDSVGGNDLSPGEIVFTTITIPAEQSRAVGGPDMFPHTITLRAVAGDGRVWERAAQP